MKKEPTESAIVTACLEYLKLKGILAWRSNNTGVFDPSKQTFRSFRGLAGVSDIIGILPGGSFFAVECKTRKGQLSRAQAAFIAAVVKNGGSAFVVRSASQLADALKESERENGHELASVVRYS